MMGASPLFTPSSATTLMAPHSICNLVDACPISGLLYPSKFPHPSPQGDRLLTLCNATAVSRVCEKGYIGRASIIFLTSFVRNHQSKLAECECE